LQNNFLVKSPNLLALKIKILGSPFQMQSWAPSHLKLHPLNPLKHDCFMTRSFQCGNLDGEAGIDFGFRKVYGFNSDSNVFRIKTNKRA